jgi:hypothetical protein
MHGSLYACVDACVCMHVRGRKYAHAYACMHNVRICTCAHAYIQTPTHIHACIHAHTHIHTYIHTYIRIHRNTENDEDEWRWRASAQFEGSRLHILGSGKLLPLCSFPLYLALSLSLSLSRARSLDRSIDLSMVKPRPNSLPARS